MSNWVAKWLIISSELLQISGSPFILHLSQLSTGNRVASAFNMSPSKPKPSEIAAEAKKTYIPYIRQNYSTQWPAQSFLCHSDALVAQPPQVTRHCRFGKNCLGTGRTYANLTAKHSLIGTLWMLLSIGHLLRRCRFL
jgi:hypothetical protein